VVKPARTRWLGYLLAVGILLMNGSSLALAQDDEPPAAGRPEDFSGLVGTYEIDTRATPTHLRVLDPLTLTIKITETSGKTSLAPERGGLHIFPPALRRDFYVEALPELRRPDARSWEFAYRVKPKIGAVHQIPPLKLTYYDPRYGKYQVMYSRSIPLMVEPPAHSQASPEKIQQPPEFVYHVQTGRTLLRRAERARVLSPLTLVFILLTPPVACAIWYVLWQRLRPDEARRARMLKSRAARHALRQLYSVRTAGDAETATVVAEYLRQRLSLEVAEPTPADVWIHLRRARISPPLAGKVHEFFRACDASRFGPAAQRNGQALAAEAEQIIHAMEAEACLSRYSW
jgi:hypothetical protein